MKLNIRRLTEKDWSILPTWWEKWPKWKAPERDFLPENGLGGIMVSKGDTDICAGFLYFTNSKAAWCEFIVSNKEYKDDDRSLAIKVLLDSLSEMGRWKGVKYVYTSLKNDSLIEKYKDCGYIQGSTGCTELIKIL